MTEHHIVPGRRLGRGPVRHDERTLRLARYLHPDLPPPPPARDWLSVVREWPMYANDQIGDCTAAAAAHMIQAWTGADTGRDVQVSESDVVRMYSAVSGYDPDTGEGDTGAVELDVLRYWRRYGIGGTWWHGRHRIRAFAAVRVTDHLEVRRAVSLFGGIYIGAALPVSAQRQIGGVWDVVDGPDAEPGSWGGHAVPVGAYDDQGLTCVTWGALQRLTWRWWDRYVDEAYAVISPDWTGADGRDPDGLDMRQLLTDLRAVTG